MTIDWKPPEISTFDLLNELMPSTFGSITVDKRKWRTDASFFPSRTFFFERRRHKRAAPINEQAAMYLTVLFRLALTSRTEFDRAEVSSRLDTVLRKAYGQDLPFDQWTSRDSKELQIQKANRQLQLLSLLLQCSVDAEYVDLERFRSEACTVIDRVQPIDAFETARRETVGFLADSVSQANYPQLISSVKKDLCVAHFHGNRWLKANIDFLRARLNRGHVSLTVILANPESPFFSAYAELKGPSVKGSEKVESKTDNMRRSVLSIAETWKDLYRDAINNGARDIELAIYFHSDVPAQALYRFDDTIIVTPTKCSNSYSFPAFVCRRTESDQDAFSSFLAEIEALVAASEKVFRESKMRLGGQRSIRTADVLSGILVQCLKSDTVKQMGWNLLPAESVPPQDYFTLKIEENPETPIDKEAVSYLITLFEIILDGRAPYKRIGTSRQLVEFINSLLGIRLKRCALGPDDPKESAIIKRTRLMAALGYTLELCIGAKELVPGQVVSMFASGGLI